MNKVGIKLLKLMMKLLFCRGGKLRCRFSSRNIAVVLWHELISEQNKYLSAAVTHHNWIIKTAESAEFAEEEREREI